jgi:hypothetical protein
MSDQREELISETEDVARDIVQEFENSEKRFPEAGLVFAIAAALRIFYKRGKDDDR